MVQFQENLRANSRPQWIPYYVDYSKLKKHIYMMNKHLLEVGGAAGSGSDGGAQAHVTPTVASATTQRPTTPTSSSTRQDPNSTFSATSGMDTEEDEEGEGEEDGRDEITPLLASSASGKTKKKGASKKRSNSSIASSASSIDPPSGEGGRISPGRSTTPTPTVPTSAGYPPHQFTSPSGAGGGLHNNRHQQHLIPASTNTTNSPESTRSHHTPTPHSHLTRVNNVTEASRSMRRELDRGMEAMRTWMDDFVENLVDRVHGVEAEIARVEETWTNPAGGIGGYINHAGSGRSPSLAPASPTPLALVSPTINSTTINIPPPHTPSSTVAASGVPSTSALRFLIWSNPQTALQKTTLSSRLSLLYTDIHDLLSFIFFNTTALDKALKKYEKVVGDRVTNLRRNYMDETVTSYFVRSGLEDRIKALGVRVVGMYACLETQGDLISAEYHLTEKVRQNIFRTHDTIWGAAQESLRSRGGGNVESGYGGASGVSHILPESEEKREEEQRLTELKKVLFKGAGILVGVAGGVGVGAFAHIFEKVEQNYCAGILIFSTALWGFESFPLFVTAILIPVLIVLLRVMTDPLTGERLPAKATAKKIFSDMFGPVIMLLLGGVTIAAALTKYNIAKSMASQILKRAGSSPHWVLLANMFVSSFSSMFISNVAAPVLCFSLIAPILRNLPAYTSPHQSEESQAKARYGKCLVIGIAMAANVGGMASPIASPQNVISMGIMNPPPSWLQWFLIALPICILLDLWIAFILLRIYTPQGIQTPAEIAQPTTDPWTLKQAYVGGVSLLTILLWGAETSLEGYVGDMGIIAVLPVVAFFGIGLLTLKDWHDMPWHVVMLAMGGIALGKAVESSGLLAVIAGELLPFLKDMSPFYCLAVLSGVVVIVTSFISHTVGALILLPVVAEIGLLLPDPRPRTLVMAAALMCSGGMALPISSFPNMFAEGQIHPEGGGKYLSSMDFVIVGGISSIGAWGLVSVVGFSIMSLLGFN